MATQKLTFPLFPRRRLIGLAFGSMHSARRGMGSDVAGSRPYRPGDDVDTIDWGSSARLSSARASDEFIVREHYADEAPRVLVVCDRRPEMALFPDSLPWLSKPRALREAAGLISESAVEARGFIGYLDYADGEPFWRPPRSQAELWQIKERHLAYSSFRAPQDNLTRAFGYLAGLRRALPPGSFLFVLSDFLVSPASDTWLNALELRWDVVPVVIQDPTWEQSFPALASVVVPFADPRDGRIRHVRLTRRQAEGRKQANERRLDELLAGFGALGLEPIVISSSGREDIFRAFLLWADQRLFWRGRGW